MCFAAAVLRGQEQAPKADPKLFDWKFSNPQFNLPARDWTAPWFRWQPANVQPKRLVLLQNKPSPSVCAVPLLAAPLNPNSDPNMPALLPPKSPIEEAEIVKVMPACPNDHLK